MSWTKPKITKVQMNLSPDTCRVCMRKNNSMRELFDSDSKIVDRIQFCTGILFTENFNLPSLICTECLSQLNIAHNFKTTCIASDVMFKKLDVKVEIEILDNTTVKEEIEDLYKDEAEIEDLNDYVGCLIEKNSNPTKKTVTQSPNPTIKIEKKPSVNATKKRVVKPSLNSTSTNTIKLEDISKRDNSSKEKINSSKDKVQSTKEKKKRPQNKVKSTVFRKLHCLRCKIRFETREESIKHHETLHNISKYVCEFCGKQFLYNSSYCVHMRIHVGPSYACAHCSYSTVNKMDLKTHLTLHTGEKKFHCHACPATFRTSSNLKTHDRQKHGGQRPFPCDRCDKSFYTKHSLGRHMDIHNNIRQHVCTVCNMGFNHRKTWKRHLKNQHAVVMPRERPGPRKTNIVIESTPSVFDDK